MIKFLLAELEKSPNPVFSRRELEAISAQELEDLRRKGILVYINPPEGKLEMIRSPRCPHGCGLTVSESEFGLEAVCLNHPDEDPISITEDYLSRYSLSVEKLLRNIKVANEIKGSLQEINGGFLYLGNKVISGTRVDFVFTRQITRNDRLKIEGLKTLNPKDQAMILLTPKSVIEDIELKSRLREGRIAQTSLADSLNIEDFSLKIDELISSLTLESSSLGNGIARFPTPEGLRWEEVTISFVSNESIRVQARKLSERYTFAEIGFKDGRKGDLPDIIWCTFRDTFARFEGEISPKTKISREEQATLKPRVSTIRKRLKRLIGIDEDPFYRYRAVRAYKTKFKLQDLTQGEGYPGR